MKVAIVHDYLTQRGGAERVLLMMCKAFPDAAVHTSLYSPDDTFPEFRSVPVRTLPINRLGVLRRNHRLGFPALAPAFSSHRVDADVVLCSSSGWAHGVRSTGRKVVYCYSPARWLYDGGKYTEDWPLGRLAASALRRPLVAWDRRAAATADRYLTVSHEVRARIRTVYRIDAEVIPPPPAADPSGPRRAVPGLAPGFFLCVSRLLPYKNVGAVVDAFAALPAERLVVVGSGPASARLRQVGPPNVSFVGAVDDDLLRWLYESSAGVVAAGYEDYGLIPLEAAAFGKPAAVLRAGGFLDTVVEGETGLFFDSPEPATIAAALTKLKRASWHEATLRAHAARFGEDRFITRLREIVTEAGSTGARSRPPAPRR